MSKNIIFENSVMRLEINDKCVATSLKYKPTGEECLSKEAPMPLFSVTQKRPFNNEIKLIYMNKRTTYPANRVRLEGDRLIVGFELAPYEAVVEVKVCDKYFAFSLVDFIVHPDDYDYLKMTTPPVEEFRLLNLSVKPREKYGKWLNVVWDNNVAVNVLSASPYARIDSEERPNARILTADAVSNIKLRGCSAALIVSKTDELLDAVDSVERDFSLPLGVESRRSDWVNSSIFWTKKINPGNVDEYISYMKKGGFRLALIYYQAIFNEEVDEKGHGYLRCGDYDYRDTFPRGDKDLAEMLAKISAAGITPGLHVLHTHIGMNSRYVTPKADRRLNTTRRFTLAKPLGKDDTVLYVDENTLDTVMVPECRILKFGTELIKYKEYTTEPPYRFIGCERGHRNTDIIEHNVGEIGGILDVSEFSATSVYVDQNSDLQDEIADKISSIYNLGFKFIYFDGSEGTNAPYEFHVPNAQYRVYKKLSPAPLFCEGAAKSHFGWHMLSGANAFDIFPTNIFKKMIDKFPVKAAEVMQDDFTRVNFGWWELYSDTQPDTYEYGMSRATAWNCPATMMGTLESIKSNPRVDDVLEVLRRWNDAKAKHVFTEEEKLSMRNTSAEHTLIINENGEYELLPYEEISEIGAPDARAFVFERGGARYISIWHTTGEGNITLPVPKEKIKYLTEVCGEEIAVCGEDGSVTLPISSRKYIKTALSREEILSAFKNSK